jgi:hypothetical protein
MKPFGKIGSKLLNIKAGPEKVSGSYALGVFLATTPFIGMKVFIALVLTTILKWSRLAAVIGVYHNNILNWSAVLQLCLFRGKLAYPERCQPAGYFRNKCRNVLQCFIRKLEFIQNLARRRINSGDSVVPGGIFPQLYVSQPKKCGYTGSQINLQ